MNIRSLVKQILTQKENRKYEKLLAERRMTYDKWIRQKETQNFQDLRKLTGDESTDVAKGILREKSADEVQVSSGRKTLFRCFIPSEGMLAENALAMTAQYFQEHPEVKILYGDEDVLEDGVRKCPWFKPDWSPDFLESCFYFGSVVAVREELIQHMEEAYAPQYSGYLIQAFSAGAEKNVFVTSDYEVRLYEIRDFQAHEKWVYQCVLCAGAFARYSDSVGHIAEILFHCKSEEQQKKYLRASDFVKDIQMKYLRDFKDGWKMNSTNHSEDSNNINLPTISAVIPSKDQPVILERCIRSFCMAARDYKTEIIIVDNGSNKDNKCYIEELTENLKQEQKIKILYLYQPMEFHFSRMCNLGAKHASGRHLLFLNDDVELFNPEVVARMGALSDRPWTGAVGLKLFYPDSDRIQHAGITNLLMGPVHKLQFLSDEQSYYYNANRGQRNVIAVTAACLMVEKEKFVEAGGFTEELPVAFNDVDLCFSLFEKGYHNVCINDMYAYHHESFSRGDDESVEKRARLMAERDKLYARHPRLEGVDPYYSRYLNREGLDIRIRPAFESAGNQMQLVAGILSKGSVQGYREDPCVHLRVESLREGILQGYCVVLGDNNACYERKLLLIQEPAEEQKVQNPGSHGSEHSDKQKHIQKHMQKKVNETIIYTVDIAGQYRSDLAENMQDQMNVALSGFWLEISKEALTGIPKGRYRVGMAVRNKVTGLKLYNKSNCYFINGSQ